jgi:hypothetical protein
VSFAKMAEVSGPSPAAGALAIMSENIAKNNEAEDKAMLCLYRGLFDKLPIDTGRQLALLCGNIVTEVEGPARRGVIMSMCDSLLHFLKLLPSPGEFAELRKEMLRLKAKAAGWLP